VRKVHENKENSAVSEEIFTLMQMFEKKFGETNLQKFSREFFIEWANSKKK